MNRCEKPLRMRAILLATLALTVAIDAVAQVPAPDAEEGLRAVARLGEINGQALACDDPPTVRRAKALMLVHAPKTARFADAYDTATQRAYLAITRREAACPEAPALATRLETVAQKLQASLPASAPAR